jgi:alpha-glucosidase
MLLLTLRGTPTLYYGDEIGLGHVPIPPGRAQDPWERNEPGHGRDPERTPMQWDDGPQAGFSAVEPWLPLSDDWATRNVEGQRSDPASMLTLHRRLLALRRDHAALAIGDYRGVRPGAAEVFAYERFAGDEVLRVVLNFGAEPQTLPLPVGDWVLLLSTRAGRAGDPVRTSLALDAAEGVILRRA